MKILMSGPPKGHNLKLYLDFFQKHAADFHLTYLYTGEKKYSFDIYRDIRFIDYKKEQSTFLNELRKEMHRYDLIWIHNWTQMYVVFLLLLFRKSKTKVNFSVWSEPIPRLSTKNNIRGWFYKWVFHQATFVQCLWYGTYRIVKDNHPKVNVVLLSWGLAPEYFDSYQDVTSDGEAQRFINQLPPEKIKFFWPKSVSSASRHDLVIKAAAKLRKQGVQNFIVYFWLGNVAKEPLYSNLKDMIRQLDVEEHVKFVEHGFLPFQDIIAIWNAVDCGLQMAAHDALSTSLMEPMLFKKEIVVSKIYPYEALEEHFGLQLNLVPNEVDPLVHRIWEVIKGKRTSDEEKERRKQVIVDHFNFEKNALKQVHYFRDHS